MSYTTKSQWLLDIDARVNANGTQAITGAILNAVLHDLADSTIWGELQSAKGVTVNAAGTTITFPAPMRTAAYKLFVRVYSAAGEAIGYTIDPTRQAASGFHILPVQDGTMDYEVRN